MTAVAKISSEVTLFAGQRRIELRKVGPASQGSIYTTLSRDGCYRLFPMSFDVSEDGNRRSEAMPAARRQLYANWIRGAGQQTPLPKWVSRPDIHFIAPILEAEQAIDERGSHWFFVHYDCHPHRFLNEVLAAAQPTERLDHLLLLLYRITGWWNDLHTGLLPMPAEVAFDERKRPFLLPTPEWCLPDVESIFAEATRALVLAPEYVCGRTAPGHEANMDRYALGVLLIQAFRSAPEVNEPAVALHRIAVGTLWNDPAPNVPLWMKHLPELTESEDAIRKLISPDVPTRSTVDPLELAQHLEACRRGMEPRTAVKRLLEEHRFAEAHALAQDILLVDDSYDMLVLAGRAAYMSDQFLDSIDCLERAITKAPSRSDAYCEQWITLTSLDGRAAFEQRRSCDPEILDRIDAKVRRNYEFLARERPELDPEDEMADHYLWLDQPGEAARFIFAHLIPADGVYRWERFELRFRYTWALLRAGERGSAQTAFSELGKDLKRAQWDAPGPKHLWERRWAEVRKLAQKLNVTP